MKIIRNNSNELQIGNVLWHINPVKQDGTILYCNYNEAQEYPKKSRRLPTFEEASDLVNYINENIKELVIKEDAFYLKDCKFIKTGYISASGNRSWNPENCYFWIQQADAHGHNSFSIINDKASFIIKTENYPKDENQTFLLVSDI